ncbi:MAG: cytochrome P450 [Flavobacteriales bacterium]|nr:cytochrome P450 [Flavobacteriales bacterium]
MRSQQMQYPSGPKGSWFTGMALELIKDPKKFFHKYAQEYPEILRFRSFYNHFYVISKPEYLQHVLQKNAKNYVKGMVYQQIKLVLGEGLLTSEGDYWLRQRRLAQPSFHRNKIAGFFELMKESTNDIILDWERERGKELDVYPEMMRLTLDIIGRTMLSTHESSHADTVKEALEKTLFGTQRRIESPIKWPFWVPNQINRTIQSGKKDLDQIIYGIISAKRKGQNRHGDLLDMLMDAEDVDTGERMNDQQLRDEILTIFLAGHETTAIVLSWALYILGSHQEEYQKLKKELAQVVANETFSITHLTELTNLTNFIHEVMRMYPPAYGIGRLALDKDQLGPYPLKAGANILMSIHHMHNDPKFWGDPEIFRPSRFENFDFRKNAFRYMPFGGGPRICIGNNFAMMEMQVVLVMLLKAFSFEYIQKTPPESIALITDRPKNGILLKVN